MEGQEAIAPIIAIVADLLLLAVSRVLRVIKVEDDELGRADVRGDTLLHKHPRQAVEVGAGDAIFKA
jgi:hypothetical protein